MRAEDSNTNRASKDITIGDAADNQMQLLQSFYAKITGKKERLSKDITLNHITSFEDLENLHLKIRQMCAPLSILHHNESIIIFHSDDTKEQFSSFTRFKAYNKSSLSPTENVHLEYNILLTQPGLQDEQNYKISIDIHSRASIMKKMMSGSKMHKFILSIIADNTATVRIDYVDYVIALNFMHTIDGWFGSLKNSGNYKGLITLKSISEDFPFAFRYISVGAYLVFCYNLIEKTGDNVELLRSSLVVFGGAYLLGGIAHRLGQTAERSIDMIFPPSYVCLNRGDNDIAHMQRSENRKGVFGVAGALALALMLNIASSYVTFLLGIN